MGLARWAGAVAALTLGGSWLAFVQPGTPLEIVAAAQPSTALEIEINGGFAIVQSDSRLDIAYLNDTLITLSQTRDLVTDESDRTVCQVTQVGTQLEIVRGKIISATPANAPELPTKIFDLDEKEVTFPALDPGPAGPGPVHTWPSVSSLPTPPSNATEWHPLRFIPGLTKHHGTLAPNWFTKKRPDAAGVPTNIVNGRVRLRGGSIRGDVPSRPQMQQSHFEFRDVATASTFMIKAAVTDRAVYSATVVGNNVEILFSNGGNSLIRKLVVEPLATGEPVKLRIRGKHNGMGPEPGGKLGDFCAFYALFDDIPDHEQWLEPFLAGSGGGGGPGPQPTPGYFCPMDWF